jgi:alanyl-tRNA synthetase
MTVDGKMVVPGEFVFKMVDTHGLPLPITLQVIHDRNMAVDWYNFMRMAIQCGWNARSLKTKVLDALVDVYGPNDCFEPNVEAILGALT